MRVLLTLKEMKAGWFRIHPHSEPALVLICYMKKGGRAISATSSRNQVHSDGQSRATRSKDLKSYLTIV
jgi:hypothetical protein